MGLRNRPLAFVSFADLLGICTCRVRLELLVSLAQRPMSVSELARRRQLALAHVSQYLGVLAMASLVEFTQRGRGRVYAASPRFTAAPTGAGLLLRIAGDDGSEVSVLVPWEHAERLGYEGVAAGTGPQRVSPLVFPAVETAALLPRAIPG